MPFETSDVIALVTALAALIGACAGVIYQIRQLRGDIVSSVETHKNETIAAILSQHGGVQRDPDNR